jgi:hypothetical protein
MDAKFGNGWSCPEEERPYDDNAPGKDVDRSVGFLAPAFWYGRSSVPLRRQLA